MTVRPIPSPSKERLSPEDRLNLVAEILAQAVLRSLYRRRQLAEQETDSNFLPETSREGLDCLAAESVHHVPTRP